MGHTGQHFVNVPIARLLSPAHLDAGAAAID